MSLTALSNMYFGTKERKTWVKAPAPGAGYSATGYSASLSYINGGAAQRNSTNSHMEYSFSWGSVDLDQIAALEDYAYALYGDGLNYWLDPVAAERNLFNRAWAAPKITAEDGISLIAGVQPSLATVGDMSLNYPLLGAQYVIPSGAPVSRSFYIPLPAGYTAWVGAHGSGATNALSIQPMVGAVASGAPVLSPMLAVNSSTRFANSFDGGSIDGLEIRVDTATAKTIILTGMMLQVLPTGQAPATGGFISGRGNSGCLFEGKPNVMPYSLPGASLGMTAKLVEVGDWL